MSRLSDAISKDIVRAPYTIDLLAKKGYENTVAVLKELESQGKLTFEYEPTSIPYVWHDILIKWKMEDDVVAVEMYDLREIIKETVGFLTLKLLDSSEWLITSVIYCPS